jgi:hypothetical protein
VSSLPISANRLVTSFPSKSELALNLSTDGRYITFMGYTAPVNGIDISNSNTPGAIDPTNPVPGASFRAIAQLDARGRVHVTQTNAYSGNNGRAAILNNTHGANVYYTAGNGGNGGNPQPATIITGTGAQLVIPRSQPGPTTPLGSFNVTQLGFPADKIGKDTNFRGLTVFDDVVYYTKGSGGNGVNTVYFVDTTGHACPNGVGVPQPGARLPTTPLAFDPATVQSQGLPNNMCVLAGFPTAEKTTTSFPFGIWFADPDTLYVADEGNADTTFAAGTYSAAAEVGSDQRQLASCLHVDFWPVPRCPVSGAGLPERCQSGDRPAVGARDRRPAQPHRPGQSGWHGDDLGGHVDGQRQRRHRCGSEPAGRGHRSARRDERRHRTVHHGSHQPCG